MIKRVSLAAIVMLSIIGLWALLRPSGHVAEVIRKVRGKTAVETAATSTGATPTKAEEPARDLAKIIEADEYCGADGGHLFSESWNGSPHPYLDLYDALVKVVGGEGDACTRAMLERNRTAALSLSESAGPGCRFFRALVLTNQVDEYAFGHAATPEEREQGKKLLEDLSAENPRNGIYSFYALALGDPAYQRQKYRDFLVAPEFEDPMLEPARKIDELGVYNAAAYLFALSARGALRNPALGRSGAPAQALAKLRLYPAEQAAFSQRLAARMEMENRLRLEEPAMDLMNTAVLKSIANLGRDRTKRQPYLLENKGWLEFYRSATARMEADDFGSAGHCREDLEKVRRLLPELKRKRLDMYDRARKAR